MPVSLRMLGEPKGEFGPVSLFTLRVKCYRLSQYTRIQSTPGSRKSCRYWAGAWEGGPVICSDLELGMKFSPKKKFSLIISLDPDSLAESLLTSLLPHLTFSCTCTLGPEVGLKWGAGLRFSLLVNTRSHPLKAQRTG